MPQKKFNTKQNTAKPAASTERETEDVSGHPLMGVIVGVLIVCLVLILGGLYLWGSMLREDVPREQGAQRVIPNNEPETPRAEADVQALRAMSSSDELSAIEADLESTMLTLDEELKDIEAVFESEHSVQ